MTDGSATGFGRGENGALFVDRRTFKVSELTQRRPGQTPERPPTGND